ncbi:alpha/beta fold hydrolase [Streptomyces sp. NPDC001546]|uniref:alpha/beta fold hydrolase n=1 Tax=Streptomyces sp. NPDC001546 TaxID=3364585 RepID=UPI0036808FDE
MRRRPRAAVLAAGTAALALCAGPAATARPPRPVPSADGGDTVRHVDRRRVRCRGAGTPTVVLVPGLHDSSDSWTLTDTAPPVPGAPAVFPGVAPFTRICLYDRPGTLRYTDRRLDRVLTARQVPGPYALVGHSYGGLITLLYAERHPDRARGLATGSDHYVQLHDPDLTTAAVRLVAERARAR